MENWYRDDSNGIRIGKDKTSLRVILGAWKKTYADTLQNRIEVLQEIRRIHGTEVPYVQAMLHETGEMIHAEAEMQDGFCADNPDCTKPEKVHIKQQSSDFRRSLIPCRH